MSISFKNFIKYFIPYGILILRQKIKERRQPIKKCKGKNIENCLIELNIKQLTDENNVFQVYRKGYKYPIYLRNQTSDVSIYKTIIEEYEYDFIVQNEPKYIIDAGANIGIASIYFAEKYPNAKIIAIEPEKENFKMLIRNTENYKNITAINAALWNTSGEISLFAANFTSDLGFMVETNKSELKPSYKQIQLTEAITIDEILKKFNIDYIDILKIDIEGAEKEVFESCRNWIDRTKYIIIELHERMKKGCNKAFYKNVKAFDKIGINGEYIFLSRDNYIKYF